MVAEVPAPTYEVTVDGCEEGIEYEAGLSNGDRSPRNDYTSHKDSMWFQKWGYPQSSSILIGCFPINPPFWDTQIYGTPQIIEYISGI